MGLFGHKTKAPAAATNTQEFNGIQLNKAAYGDVIPVLIGANRVPMKIIWAGDWTDTVTTTPGQHVGKGGGGSTTPGTTTHSYSESIQALLGYGPADRIDSFWTSSGKVGVSQISTDFTIPTGGGHFDIVDPNFSGDYGVGQHKNYSQVVNDFGSPGSQTLSGTYLSSFTRGTSPSSGVYVVSTPSAGVTRYTFAAADAGKTVNISYTTYLGTLYSSEETLVPSTAGHTWSVPNPSTFLGPNSATQVIDQGTGNAFALVSGTPGPGQFSVTTTGTFTFNSADVGKIVLIKWQSKDTTVDAANATVNFDLTSGVPGQQPWSYLTSRHPEAALSYSNIALWDFPSLHLGSSNSVPQLTAEAVHTKYMAGSGIAGANPAVVITAILTDPVWGVGMDPSLLGDWVTAPSSAYNFWQANGFFISLNQDTQSTAMDVINQILDAGQAVMFWDQGKLQLAVYGDTSCAGFGAIFQPDTQPVVEFSVDDFVAAGGSEPIKVETEPQNHVFNRVKVEWKNALVDYRTEVITEEDAASIAQNGLHEEGQQSWQFIRYVNIAQWAANLRLKRFTNIRDTYTWTVPTRYRHMLRLMKLVTVSWDHMGWNQKPLRIIKIEESHAGLALTLEEFPYGASQPTLYPKLTAQAENNNPALISPGDTALVALEIPDQMNDYTGRIVRVYADPTTPDNWGGAEIYVSGDNSNFVRLGEITSPVMMGTLGGSGMTAGTGDPDTQSITVVDTNDVPLLPASTYDFNNQLALLAIVDVSGSYEIVAYKNATLTGANTYSVDTFHRGLFGTTRAAHSAGANIIQLGEAFLEFQYQPSQDGETVYFRATSYNKLMGRLQNITDVASLSVTLSGANPGLFTNGQLNVTQSASKIKYSTSVTVESLRPAEAGAEQTTGKDIGILADGVNFQRTRTGITLSPDNPYNGDFEVFADSQVVADGWTKDFEVFGSGYSYARSGTAFSGSYAQAITNNGTSGGASVASRPFSVKPNAKYTFRCRVRSNVASAGTLYFRVLWYSNDTDMSRLGSSLISYNDIVSASGVSSANTYQQLSGELQAPSTAVFARIALYNWSGAANTTIFDRVSAQLSTLDLGAVDDNPAGGRYAGPTAGGMTDGFQILVNPDFASGDHSQYGVYDNNATGHVTHSTVADSTAPNASGYRLHLNVAGGGESPGLGGFYVAIGPDSGSYAVNTYHKGATIIWRIRARIPAGYSIQFASNAFGNEGTYAWLTSQAGTGDWFEYVMKQVIGTTGTFSSTGFWYLSGTFSSAFTWDVAMCSGVCISLPASISVDQHPRVQYFDRFTGKTSVSTALNPQGAIVPGVGLPVTVNLSPTSIQVISSNQTRWFGDGSTITVLASNTTFSSLTSSTTYYLYMRYSVSTGAVSYTHGTGTPPTSPSQQLAAEMAFDGYSALGVLVVTTQSSGGGGGGGGGSGDPGGTCPEGAEPVEVQGRGVIAARDVEIGDMIKGNDLKTGAERFRRVKNVVKRACSTWRIVNGHRVTQREPVWIDGKWQPAYQVAPNIDVFTGVSVRITVDAEEYDDHNYWLVDGEPLLTHNFIPYC
jgi:hypothetical protein